MRGIEALKRDLTGKMMCDIVLAISSQSWKLSLAVRRYLNNRSPAHTVLLASKPGVRFAWAD